MSGRVVNDCMIPRAADRHRALLEAINRGEGYDYANGGPISPPKPRILDATWTDDYGRTYHLVGRERLTAAEDEIARLTINLAETERERQKAVERERKTAARGAYSFDSYISTVDLLRTLGAKGLETPLDAARRVVAERDEAVEREAKTAEALNTSQAVVADVAAACGLNGTSLDRTVAEIDRLSPSPKSTQSGAEPAVTPLPTPDCDNPSHLRWAAGVVEDVSDMGWSLDISGDDVGFTLRAEAARLEAAQQQDNAEKALVEKTARVIAVDSPPDALDYDTARALLAAGLLRGGDEQ